MKRVNVPKVRKGPQRRKRKAHGSISTLGWVLLSIAILLLVADLIVFLLLHKPWAPEGKESKKKAALRVDEVYFVSGSPAQEPIPIDIFLFISNVGDEECSVSIRAFAVNTDTELAMDDDTLVVGKVENRKTKEVKMAVSLPSGGEYRVEFLVFKDGRLSVRGVGKVSLDRGSQGQDYRTTESDPDLSSPERRDEGVPSIGPSLGGAGASGFTLALAIPAILLLGFIARRRYR